MISQAMLSSDFKLQQTSRQEVDFSPNLFDHVTISKAEHEFLVGPSCPTAAPASSQSRKRLVTAIKYYMDGYCNCLAMFGPFANDCQLQSEREYRMLRE
jgi:hypothetical protein